MIYQFPGNEDVLMQGDILDSCPLLDWDEIPDSSTHGLVSTIRHRAVVFTQACDLVNGKASKVLVAAVYAARQMVELEILSAKMIREQVRTHRVYGWYFLPAAGPMEESIVDLRDLHTIPRVMLDQLVREGKRVCRIATPYREHMAQHFSVTYSRIGLPEQYPSEPE